ncbi:MAG: hypothetical protein WCF23_02110 [Candidatus Nitrosopolaris sp.]
MRSKIFTISLVEASLGTLALRFAMHVLETKKEIARVVVDAVWNTSSGEKYP